MNSGWTSIIMLIVLLSIFGTFLVLAVKLINAIIKWLNRH